MNPVLFSIMLMISCPNDIYQILEIRAQEENCTVEDIVKKVLKKRITGECTCRTIEVGKRDEVGHRKRVVLEYLSIEGEARGCFSGAHGVHKPRTD